METPTQNRSTDDLIEIHITTIQAKLTELTYEKAWSKISHEEELEAAAAILEQLDEQAIREFVEVSDSGIEVGVNASEIDESAVWRAINMLAKVDDLSDKGKHEFGPEINYEFNDTQIR